MVARLKSDDVERIARQAVAEVVERHDRQYQGPKLERLGWARPGDIVFLQAFEELEPDLLERLSAGFKELGLKVVVIGPGMQVIEDPQRSSLTVPTYGDESLKLRMMQGDEIEVPLLEDDFDRMSQDESEPDPDGL